MALQGMDVVAVRDAATRLDGQANAIQDVVIQIDNVVGALPGIWEGQDAKTFADWWQSQHKVALTNAKNAIEGLARAARANADDQEAASAR